MGFSQCGVPGCKSRTGCKILFRKFPSGKPNLAREWMKFLPHDFRISANAAVCELHFDSDEFEKVRSDGRKRLKDSAVPRLKLSQTSLSSQRRPFQALDNTQANPLSPKSSIAKTEQIDRGVLMTTSTPVRPVNAITPAFTPPYSPISRCALRSQKPNSIGRIHIDHSYSKSYNISKQTDTVVDSAEGCTGKENVSPGTRTPSPRKSLPSLSIITEQCDISTFPTPGESMEAATESLPTPSTPVVGIDCDKENVSPVTRTPSPRKSFTSLSITTEQCDISTFPTPGESMKAATESLPTPVIPISDPPPLSVNLSAASRKSLLDLIASQKAQIQHLTVLNRQKMRKNAELARTVGNIAALQRKHRALQKVNSRLQSKLRSRSWSPWLSVTQVKALSRKSTRGLKWDPDSVREGLIMKMRCGTSGYTAFVQRFPLLPSARKLQEAVQFIKFESGILHEIFDLLEVFAKTCTDKEKDCQIVIDELAIEEGERYDHSTKKFVGHTTFPIHSGLATKALVIMLAGILKRWKISVAVYFTRARAEEFKKKAGQPDENHTGTAFARILSEIIRRTEATALKVSNITGDMGPDNLAMWRAYDISGGKRSDLRCSFPNPARPDSKVFVLPDAVHLLKSIKVALESNQVIHLPPEIVEEENLPSSVVDYRHLDDLLEFEKDNELKVAFRLKPENVHCKKQYPSMNVGTSKAVVCHRTGVGLQLMAQDKDNKSYLTTAWFIMLLNTFFQLVTCRGGALALSKGNLDAYNKAISLIKKVDNVFQNIRIGQKGEWKPCQRGMRVLCASLLGLQEYFLDERGYSFLLLARFTQDCIENLFSAIRLRQPTPHAVALLHCLKVITLTQYSTAVKGSSYEYEESAAIEGVDFLAEARSRALDRAQSRFFTSLDELFANPIVRLTLNEMSQLTEFEEAVVYDMAGSTIASLQTSNINFCESCLNAVKIKSGVHHQRAFITEMKEFTELRGDDGTRELQIYVTDEVFRAILTSELTFRKYRHLTLNFRNTDILQYFVENLMFIWEGTSIPDCHGICRRILQFFIQSRLKEFGRKRHADLKQDRANTRSIDRSSKSMGKKDAANLITKAALSKK